MNDMCNTCSGTLISRHIIDMSIIDIYIHIYLILYGEQNNTILNQHKFVYITIGYSLKINDDTGNSFRLRCNNLCALPLSACERTYAHARMLRIQKHRYDFLKSFSIRIPHSLSHNATKYYIR